MTTEPFCRSPSALRRTSRIACRTIGWRARCGIDDDRVASRSGDLFLGIVLRRGAWRQCENHFPFHLGCVGRLCRRLGRASRYAFGSDACGCEFGFVSGSRLFDRIYERLRRTAPVLRLPFSLYVRYVDAGDGRQLPAAVLRLGGRWPCLLFVDWLLVQKEIRQ